MSTGIRHLLLPLFGVLSKAVLTLAAIAKFFCDTAGTSAQRRSVSTASSSTGEEGGATIGAVDQGIPAEVAPAGCSPRIGFLIDRT